MGDHQTTWLTIYGAVLCLIDVLIGSLLVLVWWFRSLLIGSSLVLVWLFCSLLPYYTGHSVGTLLFLVVLGVCAGSSR